MYALVINPANSSLNRRTQHFMQPTVPIIRLLHNYLWIHHTPPPRHLSDTTLSTNVFPQNVSVEGVRGDIHLVGTGIDVWTRAEEH